MHQQVGNFQMPVLAGNMKTGKVIPTSQKKQFSTICLKKNLNYFNKPMLRSNIKTRAAVFRRPEELLFVTKCNQLPYNS